MKVDFLRVGLIFLGILAGLATYFFAPALGDRAPAFANTVVTVFAILAGFQLTIFALLSGLRPSRFRRGTSVVSAKRVVRARRLRQLLVFYAYFAVVFAIILNQAFDFGELALQVERFYVALSLTALVWSLGLPFALSSTQEDSREP